MKVARHEGLPLVFEGINTRFGTANRVFLYTPKNGSRLSDAYFEMYDISKKHDMEVFCMFSKNTVAVDHMNGSKQEVVEAALKVESGKYFSQEMSRYSDGIQTRNGFIDKIIWYLIEENPHFKNINEILTELYELSKQLDLVVWAEFPDVIMKVDHLAGKREEVITALVDSWFFVETSGD